MTLDFIYSKQKRDELLKILNNNHPTHNQRLYFVGFLNKVCGFTGKDIKKIIQTQSSWGDFESSETDKQLASVCSDFVCEDSFINNNVTNSEPSYRVCQDTSIFSKLNKEFFKDAEICAYEYSLGKYNQHGKMIWMPQKFPIYRSIEASSHLMWVLDVDGNPEYSLDIIRRIENIESWDGIKWSGNRGFHIYKKVKNKTRQELLEQTKCIFNTIKTNLVSFTVDNSLKKHVNIDPVMFNLHHLVRGFCIHLKSNKYSIPITSDMDIDEIISISSDIKNVEKYLLDNYK